MINPILEKGLSRIEEEASALGMDLHIENTRDANSKLLINSDAGKVAVLALVDISEQEVLVSYMINVHKWAWAEAEGFTKDQIIDEFSSEVFRHVDLNDLVLTLKN